MQWLQCTVKTSQLYHCDHSGWKWFNNLFEELSLKFYLYVGHTVQVINQKKLLKQIDYSSVCVVVMDFNTKYKTMRHNENAVENFGRRGISWHCALVFYSVWVYVEPYIYEMWLEKIYINHRNVFNNKQDTTCVILLI